MNLYVGNLPWSVTENELETLFAKYGTVDSTRLITDRETGRARGFGFVEMDDDGAREAMQALDGSDLDGRAMKVNESKPREPRSDGGGGGGRW